MYEKIVNISTELLIEDLDIGLINLLNPQKSHKNLSVKLSHTISIKFKDLSHVDISGTRPQRSVQRDRQRPP